MSRTGSRSIQAHYSPHRVRLQSTCNLTRDYISIQVEKFVNVSLLLLRVAALLRKTQRRILKTLFLTSIALSATILMHHQLQVLATKSFSRWMRKNKVSQQNIAAAAAEMAEGLIDADLGGHVVKKRVALGGRGKRSGARTIVATNFGNKWIYIFGFEKSERGNIDASELKALQELAKTLLELTIDETSAAILHGELMEIKGVTP